MNCGNENPKKNGTINLKKNDLPSSPNKELLRKTTQPTPIR